MKLQNGAASLLAVDWYLGADHHMFDRRDKPDTTCQQVNLGMEAYLGAV